MPRPLKVYGWTSFRPEAKTEFNHHRQTREVVAAHSIAEVLRITGMTRHALNHSCSETGNPEDIETAMSQPGVVFWRPLNGPSEYTPSDRPDGQGGKS